MNLNILGLPKYNICFLRYNKDKTYPFHWQNNYPNKWLTLFSITFTVPGWHHHYQDKLFPEPLYTNLKIPPPSSINGTVSAGQSPHITPYPDSTSSHNLHHHHHAMQSGQQQHSSVINAHPSTQLASIEPPPDSSIGSYHNSGYPSYRSSSDLPTSTVSSTEPDYGANVGSSNQSSTLHINANVNGNSGCNGDGTGITNGSIHHRRGSLQLWQFLVALLDEPAAR